MKKLSYLLAVAITLLSLLAINRPAQAAFSGTSYSLSCTSASVSGTSSIPNYYGPNTIWFVVYDVSAGFVVDTSVATDGSGNFSYATSFPAVDPTHVVLVDVWDGDGLDRLFEGSCDISVAGPGIPDGFVLKTITCDVAVFDAPAGQPVGDNRLKAGQTWYVNPAPVKGSDGKSWTEVFAGGAINGFIPTSCVGG